MALIVQKFGGSSVADRDRIFNVANIVKKTHDAGNDVVVVVSAQGDTTDDLIAKAAEIIQVHALQSIMEVPDPMCLVLYSITLRFGFMMLIM